MAETAMSPEAKLAASLPGLETAPGQMREPAQERTETRVGEAIRRGVSWLLAAQAPEGFWWGELEADTTLESDYVLYQWVLRRFDPARIAKLANYIRQRQLPDGGWNIYPGGPAEINATVKAYFALKLAGDDAGAPHIELARARVLRLGGLEATNSYTRFYLAMVGALGWDLVPAIPPELLLLPAWFFINIYEMSSWTRAILIPLAIIYAQKPEWRIPKQARVDELFRGPSGKADGFVWSKTLFCWRNFFLLSNRAMQLHERLPWKPLRRVALEKARAWMLEHLERSEGLGTIYPAMLNSVLALLALGYATDDPLTAREIDFLQRYEIEEEATLRIQPCISPIWDTAIVMVSLQEAGLEPGHPAILAAGRWLVGKQILGSGDWQVKNRDSGPGGWAFEFRNDFFPDVDDTAFVLMALARACTPRDVGMRGAMQRGVKWLLSMQNRDGGWAAFDRDNNLRLLTQVPFADHNAMLDPSTADVTARVLECLGRLGWPSSHAVLKKGLEFLQRDQDAEGPWFGRWGVNYVYGTSGVLRALETLGLSQSEDCRRAVLWLKKVQNPDGGFGESIATYQDASLKGQGKSTASQTAWGLIGLLASCEPHDPAVQRAVGYLLDHQNSDGSWDESEFTATGFPRVFYLKYHLYRNAFPVYALARFFNQRTGQTPHQGMRLAPEQLNKNNFGGRNEISA